MTDKADTPLAPLIWIDLETTGLDPNYDVILEVGLVATDGDLLPIVDPTTNLPLRTLQMVIRPNDGLDVTRLHPAVVEMHSKSGLLVEIAGDDAYSISDAGGAIHSWLLGVLATVGTTKGLMAGSTVGQFDRQFFKRAWPEIHDKFFEYRNVDVSTVKELVRRWYGETAVFKGDDKRHRVLPDIEDSLRELRHYRSGCFSAHFEHQWFPDSKK